MKRGALAMFDALGFKGIWQRPGIKDQPEIVLNKLQALRQQAHLVVNRYLPPGPATEEEFERELAADRSRSERAGGERAISTMNIRFLSDTIVVGITAKSEDEWVTRAAPGDPFLQSVTVLLACRVASELLHEAAISAPPLVYRGCVAYGDFEIDGNFIIGDAVDRAAEALDMAQGAFIWLLPEAKAVYDACSPEAGPEVAPLRYRVPLKGGDAFDTYAVSPLSVADEADVERVSKAMLDTFNSPAMDVQVKRQNTATFLDACATARRGRLGG